MRTIVRTTAVGLSRTTILVCVMVAGATQLISIPFFGALSDRSGRRRQYLVCTVLMAVFASPEHASREAVAV